MDIQLVDITDLSAVLITISAVVMVLVDMLKTTLKPVASNKNIKYATSVILAVAITLFTGTSLFEPTSDIAFYVGAILAGLVASLGSNFIHEIMKVLQTVKGMQNSQNPVNKFKR